jgi:hypothetical protein
MPWPRRKRIAALKESCREAGIPSIYVNDNFGKWRSDFKALIRSLLEDKTRGREIVRNCSSRASSMITLS